MSQSQSVFPVSKWSCPACWPSATQNVRLVPDLSQLRSLTFTILIPTVHRVSSFHLLAHSDRAASDRATGETENILLDRDPLSCRPSSSCKILRLCRPRYLCRESQRRPCSVNRISSAFTASRTFRSQKRRKYVSRTFPRTFRMSHSPPRETMLYSHR